MCGGCLITFGCCMCPVVSGGVELILVCVCVCVGKVKSMGAGRGVFVCVCAGVT